MLRFFLILGLCGSIAFAAVPPKHTDSYKRNNLSKRLTAAQDKIFEARKKNFSNVIPAEKCCDDCDD